MANRLNANQQLNVNDSITSNSGLFKLIMQADGNLVLYTLNINPLWASNTNGKPVVKAVMQGDGNFVLYDTSNHAYWATNTNNHPGAYLIMQDDGNLVVYGPDNKPLWASNTVQKNTTPLRPGYYFSMDDFTIINTRSRVSDTDTVAISVTVVSNGDQYRAFQTVTKTQFMGDLDNGSSPKDYKVNLALGGINLSDTDIVVFAYHITNTGQAQPAVVRYLEQTLEAIVKQQIDNALKPVTGAPGTPGVLTIALGPILGAIAGVALSVLVSDLLSDIWGLVFPNCDGPVAVGSYTCTGAQLKAKISNGPLKFTDDQPGVDSNAGCGSNSHYKVSWHTYKV